MKIVFKCHTPFTMMMSVFLGEVYFKQEEKILITSFLPNEKFYRNVLKLNLFTKVYQFNEGTKLISGVEKEVDDFLNEFNNIDMFFVAVLSDRFSNMLVYKLKDKAKICIYPEGSSIINIQQKWPVIFDIIKKTEYIREFFDKYPINFDNYDEIWTFDTDSVLGLKKKIVKIDMKKSIDDELISNLNILFKINQINFDGIDCVYLDDYLVERGWLFKEIEEMVLKDLFSVLNDKQILVKAHPGQNMALIRNKFKNKNCYIFENADIPWELLFLNIVRKNNNIILVSPIFSTAFITSAHLIDANGKLFLISLFNMLKEYMNKYLIKSMDLSKEYYEALRSETISVMFPKNIEELCENICMEKKINTCKKSTLNYTKRYFEMIGNLICESCLFVNGKRYVDVFDALKTDNELVFEINSVIDDKMNWVVDSMNFCKIIGNIEVELFYSDEECSVILNEEDISKEGICSIGIYDNTKLCKEVRIRFKCISKDNCIELLKDYKRTFWRGVFWQKWSELDDYGSLNNFLSKNRDKDIWIYGKGRIGEKIKNKLMLYDINVEFIESSENVEKNIRGKSYVLQVEKKPDLLIITPMQDYLTIFYSMPPEIRMQTVSLEKFLEMIEQQVEI